MDFSTYLTHPVLKHLISKYEKDHVLFKQGQLGSTMFVILQGEVRILSHEGMEDFSVATLGPGEFLGERALIKETAYRRHFTAKTVKPTIVIELGRKEFASLRISAPDVMENLLIRSFEINATRLDNANYLLRVLKSSDNFHRLVQSILYLANTIGHSDGQGTHLPQLVDWLHHHIDLSKEQIKTHLKELTRQGLLKPKPGGTFVLVDYTNLFALLEPKNKKKAA